MLNTEKFITKIREVIIDETSLTSAYSPDLPQDGELICAVTLLGGNSNDNLCNRTSYYTMTFRALIRGNLDDIDTRPIADEIYNVLHLKKNINFTDGKIINVLASTLPVYVGRDENQRILYNITFQANVESEE